MCYQRHWLLEKEEVIRNMLDLISPFPLPIVSTPDVRDLPALDHDLALLPLLGGPPGKERMRLLANISGTLGFLCPRAL